MDGNVLHPKLLSRLSRAGGLVRAHDFIQVYSHYDADGLSAAGIVTNALLRESKEFRVTTFTTLDEDAMQVIRDCESECIIITDLGASYIKELEELNKDVIVLDHHTVRDDSEKITYVNPHLFGVDGGSSACAATMALLFATRMNDKNWDLVQIAFGGITGDKQHLNGLSGYNEYVLDEGMRRGFIEISEGSLIPFGDIVSSMYTSTEPYIRGVSGNLAGIKSLLKDADVPIDRSYAALSDDEKRKLSSLIAVKLLKQGVTPETMSEVAKTRYYLKDWKMDAEMLSELLDACGRQMLQGVGIGLCLGSENSRQTAMTLRDKYNKDIMAAVIALENGGLHQMENIQWIDTTESGYTGVLCGIVMRFLGDPNKPVIGVNSSEEKVKLSGRATSALLKKGVDLATALNLSTSSVGGEGGGHKVASGGSIPQGTEKDFLENIDTIIGEQLRNAM